VHYCLAILLGIVVIILLLILFVHPFA